MNNNITIFDILYPKYKIIKPIRLIELFGGYGSQALALKYLGVEFEHWKLVEWAINSIQAYKDIHFLNKEVKIKEERTKEEMVEFLYQKGISRNYNEPMTKEQISRLSERELKTIIQNIYITHNLVDIKNVKGEDLEIKDTEQFTYLLTYSFPCQDLSNAGLKKGMSDKSTRSGMLWEVERILTDCREKPQILLMENVPMIHSIDNVQDFNKWQLRLEELGYKNYWQDLIATDYGIPQTRNRCFMISILGDYNYTFPKPVTLKLKLSDFLEKEVSKKYLVKEGTLTALQGGKATDNHILVKNATKKGYIEAKIGDGIDITSRMEYHRGTVQKDKSQTIMTNINVGTLTEDFKIRNLTPKECFRLQGVKDEDFEKCAKNQSDSSLYHLAGDSIVVNVLMAIFKELL